jgi:titin
VRVPHRRVSTVFLAALLAIPASGIAVIATSEPALAAGEPDAPTAVVATRGNTEASVAFTPGSDNGNAISRFDATCTSSGNPTGTAFDVASPVVVTGLTNGASYTCTVTATNIMGVGLASDPSNAFVPATIPSAPTITLVNRQNAAAQVNFTPGSNGGEAVSVFTATCISSGSGVTGGGTAAASPITATGLTNGQPYTCTVTATNVIGTSVPSVPSSTFTPAHTPDAPTIGIATEGDTTATVAFTPGFDGGTPVTLFTAICTSSNGGITRTNSNTVSPIVVTNTTNGRTYTCKVTATNSLGIGPESAASNAILQPGPPAPPTAVVGTPTPGNTADITFTPAFDGGDPITGYAVSCLPLNPIGAPSSNTGASSPITVSALTNGVSYVCRVTATNINGTSAQSGPSPSFAHETIPQAPTDVDPTPGNGSASVAFTSGGDGGDPGALGFLASCTSSDGGAFLGEWSGQSSPIVVGGLTNGKTYTCKVRATNGHGASPYSLPSPSFVVSAIPGVPGPPTIGTVVPGSETATVSFTPGNPGSAPIDDFTASCISSNGGAQGSALDIASPITVLGLTNGKTYTCAVTERNSFGDSLLSARTAAFVVGTIPGAPRSPSAIPANGAATVRWSAPTSNGGAPITGYVVTTYLGPTAFTPRTINSPATSTVMSNLTNGKTYTFKIAAKNAIGVGAKSVASAGVLVGTPGPPRGVTAKPGEGQATVTWQAPAAAPSKPITGYVITPYLNGVAKPAVNVPALPRSRVFFGLGNGKTRTSWRSSCNLCAPGSASQRVGISLRPAAMPFPSLSAGRCGFSQNSPFARPIWPKSSARQSG